MTPAELLALAQRLRDHAATLAPNATREDMIEAARYLRECAEAEPVATVRVHNTGGNAGIAWSGVPTEHAGAMRGGTPLYTHPQPQQVGVPEGWKLAPVEPTVEMRRAGTAANDGIVSDIYRAMLAAAPNPPSAQADAIEALRMALDALACTGESHDPGHRCGHCDEYVDRNSVVRKLIRAVLAEQGGGNAE